MSEMRNNGIYEVNSRYGRYLVCKWYGEIYKERICLDIRGCYEQVAEWDEDLCKKTSTEKLLPELLPFRRLMYNHKRKVYYVYETGTNVLVVAGDREECSKMLGTSNNAICNCANQPKLLLKKYDVTTTPRGKSYKPVKIDVNIQSEKAPKSSKGNGVIYSQQKCGWMAYLYNNGVRFFQVFSNIQDAVICSRDYLSVASA